MEKKEINKIVERMAQNPKIAKAVEGILAPLEQEGDSVTISTEEDGHNQK